MMVRVHSGVHKNKGDTMDSDVMFHLMKLLRKPYIPTYLPKIVISYKKASEKGWLPFSKVNMRIIYN